MLKDKAIESAVKAAQKYKRPYAACRNKGGKWTFESQDFLRTPTGREVYDGCEIILFRPENC